MALDTQDQRSSAIHIGLPWRGMFPIPDGGLDVNNRAEVVNLFGDHFIPLVTGSDRLQFPVNCVMAGNQLVRKGYSSSAGLRRIFGE